MLRNHPWFGVRNPDLTFLTAPRLIEDLERLKERTDELIDWVGSFISRTSIPLDLEMVSLVEFVEAALGLPEETDQIGADLVPAVADPASRRVLDAFRRKIRAIQSLKAEITEEAGFLPRWSNEEIESTVTTHRL